MKVFFINSSLESAFTMKVPMYTGSRKSVSSVLTKFVPTEIINTFEQVWGRGGGRPMDLAMPYSQYHHVSKSEYLGL